MDKNIVCIETAKKVLKDFERDNYISDSFKVYNPEEVNKWIRKPFSYDAWEVTVLVPDEQWIGAKSGFSIFINDETMEPFMFWDGGAEGRTPQIEIVKKNGKYQIGEIWKK